MQFKLYIKSFWIKKFLRKIGKFGHTKKIGNSLKHVFQYYKKFNINYALNFFECIELMRPAVKTLFLKKDKKIINLPIALSFKQQYGIALMWISKRINSSKKVLLSNRIGKETQSILTKQSDSFIEKDNLRLKVIENRTSIRFKPSKFK